MGSEARTKTNRFGATRTLKSSPRQLDYMAEYRKRPEVIARDREWRRTHPRPKDRSRLPFGVSASVYWKDVNSRRKDWAAAWRRGHLLKRYGITLADYSVMAEAQGGKCAMPFCQRTGRLTVDHDHITGEVRGLLCVPCNGFLGFFERNPNLVRQVRMYLRKKREWKQSAPPPAPPPA